MTLKRKYNAVNRGLQASYSIFDGISGVAYQVLYPGSPAISVGSGGGLLRPFIYNSAKGNGTQLTSFNPETGASYVLDMNAYFDIDVGKTISLEGTAIFTFNYSVQTTGKTYDFYLEYILSRFRDGVDTEIATGVSSTETGTSASAADQENAGGSIVIPRTTYKKGDLIRLRVKSWSKNSTAGTTIQIGHDPSDTAFAANTLIKTVMKVWLPFRVNL